MILLWVSEVLVAGFVANVIACGGGGGGVVV